MCERVCVCMCVRVLFNMRVHVAGRGRWTMFVLPGVAWQRRGCHGDRHFVPRYKRPHMKGAIFSAGTLELQKVVVFLRVCFEHKEAFM